MPRIPHSFAVADISALARSLHDQMEELARLPSHLELLNMLARGAGFQNFQHFKAKSDASRRVDPPAEPAADMPGIDLAYVQKVARLFDDQGRMTHWPSKEKQSILCLWYMWSKVPAGQVFSEKEFNAVLNAWHLFGDHALIRRAMFEMKLISRTREGRDYRRIEQEAPAELAVLVANLKKRRTASHAA